MLKSKQLTHKKFIEILVKALREMTQIMRKARREARKKYPSLLKGKK